MAKILLVEDDPMISEIYQRKFSEAGFEVDIAASGKEVLKKAGESEFDIILLDLVLPEISGMEILRELKKGGKYSSRTKVIIFSNLTEKEEQDEAIDNGADGFIAKTRYAPSDLVKEVQRILGEYKEQEKNINRQRNGNNHSNGTKKRILLIEDEEIFLELFGKKLRDEGYKVEIAKNGAWGAKEAAQKHFDLIILDVVMPAMSGSEMVERLKMEEKTKNIPIIVLSASAADEDLAKIKKMGVTDCFVKTQIVPSDLARKVGEILENR